LIPVDLTYYASPWAPTSARGGRSENGYLLATYVIKLDENGCLKSSRRIKDGESTEAAGEGNIWYAYLETNPPSPWFNGQTYIDTLSTEAIGRFIESTHNVYKSAIGDKFGSTVPCIFTDEPQFATKTQLSDPKAVEDVFLPWTTDLVDTFRQEYGTDLLENLPEIFWDLPNRHPSIARYRFHDHVCERFVSAFMDQLGNWCRSNKIMLNGHMMEEPTLYSQTTALGEAMRCYRSQELPGIDLLDDGVEYNTAKQASSIARQNGVRGTMSEIYGCTHWFFTFEGHKGCGDWQAALGITFRVQHLTWVSMAGEGKRDYPACIGYQSPWYKQYPYVEGHFARVGVAMTRGRAVTRVGVIHPIESFWLGFGPNGVRDELPFRNQAFADLSNWLLHGLIDFDFIAESLLPDQYGGCVDRKLKVGKCEYDVVILPNLRTIRSSTAKILSEFAANGGKILMCGQTPEFIDAQVPPGGLKPTIQLSVHLPWARDRILSALSNYRDLRVTTDDGHATDTLLYQMREDGQDRYLFMCNTDRVSSYQTIIRIRGNWQIENMDTFSGDLSPLDSQTSLGWTPLRHKFDGCGSILYRLTPRDDSLSTIDMPEPGETSTLRSHPLRLQGISLSEPNVLLLDYASYKIDDGKWSSVSEILKIDNKLRDHFGLPRKGLAWKQPWTISSAERESKAVISLRYTFKSEMDLDIASELAVEDIRQADIHINGTKLLVPDGQLPWWVDEAILRAPVPGNLIKKGLNTITMKLPFGILTNIERIYLLGQFSVRVNGPQAILEQPRHSFPYLHWGNITSQGYPFYVGNITYKCKFTLKNRANTILSVPKFSSPVLGVTGSMFEGTKHIIIQPRTLALGRLDPGIHEVEITAFGNRFNAFGHVHLPDWFGGCWPDVWRSMKKPPSYSAKRNLCY
jgi:hypothetical protein